jgi:hypothetical protein
MGEKNPFFGKTHSAITKKKISVAKLGTPSFNKGRTGAQSPWFGRKHTAETKLKMSKNSPSLGVTRSTDVKAKISQSVLIAMANPEIKARHLAAQKRRRERENKEKECRLLCT